MAPFFGQKRPNHVVLEGLQHPFAGRQEGESKFDVSLNYWKLSTTINRMIQLPSVSMLLKFESKNDLFSEKLQNLGTRLELVTCRCLGLN